MPGPYLAKSLQALARAGIVESFTGRHGGYHLGRPAESISLLDVVQTIDGDKRAFRCSEIRRRGPSAVPSGHYSATCAIAAAMWGAEDSWRQQLSQVSIAQLAGQVMGQASTHHYRATCTWSGSTGAGYRSYARTHAGAAPPARAALRLSSDPAFVGDVDLLNPEQLVVLAASSCQLLSFLAAAARARIDVVAYEDHAVALMPEGDPPTRITEIHLRPGITVRAPATEARVRALIDTAHRECFIANSLKTPIAISPTIDILAGEQPHHDARAIPGTTTGDP